MDPPVTPAGPTGVYVARFVDPDRFAPGMPVVVCFNPGTPIDTFPLTGPGAVRDSDGDPVVSLDLTPLSAAQFLDALRALARSPHVPTITIDNGGTPATLRPRTICIPVDERLPAIVHKWIASSDPDARLFAASLLGQTAMSQSLGTTEGMFTGPTPEVPINIPDRIALLRRLLSDPWLVDARDDVSPFTPRVYAVREVARSSLGLTQDAANLFDSPPPPADIAALQASTILTAPNTQYQRFPFAWPILLLGALSLGIYLFARRREWPLRVAPALLPVCALIALGAYRSTFIADDFFWAHKPFCLSLTICEGGVQLLAYDRFPASMPLAHAAIVPDVTVGDARSYTDHYFWHHFGTVFEPDEAPLAPVHAIAAGHRDFTDPTTVTSIAEPTGILHGVPYLVVPYRDILLAAAAILLLSCAPAISALKRRRRARKAGLCPRCGFDVRIQRASPDPRCPECGTAIRPSASPHDLTT